MVSIDDLYKVLHGLYNEPLLDPYNSRWQRPAIFKIVKSPCISIKNHPTSIKFGTQQQICN